MANSADLAHLIDGGRPVYWTFTGIVALASLGMAKIEKDPKQQLFTTYLGDFLVILILFDIANPNQKAFWFSFLGASVKLGMTLIRATKLKKLPDTDRKKQMRSNRIPRKTRTH